MEDELIRFGWFIPEGGYRCELAIEQVQPNAQSASPEPYVIPNSTRGSFYEPLSEVPSEEALPLFVEFSKLDGSEEDALLFANAHGWLGLVDLVRNASGQVFQGERLSHWKKEIRAMRRAVELYEAKRGEQENLIQWDHEKASITIHTKDGGVSALASKDFRSPLYKRLVAGGSLNYTLAAQAALMETVNKKLAGSVSPYLFFKDSELTIGGEMRPNSLLAAMWMQFHQAITGERRMHRCSHCQKWMEIPEESRSTKAMHARCVVNKKMSLYRERQRKAREMAARKVPIPQIASKLKTKAATVRKWIKS